MADRASGASTTGWPARPAFSPVAQPDDAQFVNPWLAYTTPVDPGSQIRFSSPSVGMRVDGQGANPHLDGNLVAGPDTAAFAWPGSDIQATNDGGQTWTAVLSVKDGVWTVDLAPGGLAVAVGVDQLESSTNGGSSWQLLTEPSSPLVRVDFVSSQIGYGVSVDGRMWASSDGGHAWANLPAAGAVTSECFTNSVNGYVTDQTGAIGRTTDGGATWQTVGSAPLSTSVGPAWSDLSCSGSTVASEVSLLDPQEPETQPFAVRTAPATGGTFAIDEIRNATSPLMSSRETQPASGNEMISKVAAGGSSTVAIGVADAAIQQASGNYPQARVISQNGNITTGSFPTAGASSSASPTNLLVTSSVQGLSAVGSEFWALVQTLGSAEVFHSADGGATWSKVSDIAE